MPIKNANGDDLNAFIIKPENFDPNKKYPVIMYAYNGPGHQLAVDRFSLGLDLLSSPKSETSFAFFKEWVPIRVRHKDFK